MTYSLILPRCDVRKLQLLRAAADEVQIGLVNHSSAFASEWFAESAREGRHVSMNNREHA